MLKTCITWLLAACACLATNAVDAETFERITPAQAGQDPARLEQLRVLLEERGCANPCLAR